MQVLKFFKAKFAKNLIIIYACIYVNINISKYNSNITYFFKNIKYKKLRYNIVKITRKFTQIIFQLNNSKDK